MPISPFHYRTPLGLQLCLWEFPLFLSNSISEVLKAEEGSRKFLPRQWSSAASTLDPIPGLLFFPTTLLDFFLDVSSQVKLEMNGV